YRCMYKGNMLLTDIVHQFLQDIGTEYVYGIPGSPIVPIYHTLLESDSIKMITTRLETNAISMASGVSRSSMKTGICLVTTGPGSALIIDGLLDAIKDRVPIIA